MNQENVENDLCSPSSRDETESARKRMRLAVSPRKSWSLTDKKTDPESLEEMGVSLLEPDDMETLQVLESSSLIRSGSKRKRNIENVNPNINSASSSAHKTSPSKRSPRNKVCSPVAGPSFTGYSFSESSETQQTKSEDSILPYEQAWIDEETPGQLVGVTQRNVYNPIRSDTPRTKEVRPLAPLELEERITVRRSPSTGPDAFSALTSDEMLLGIFKWLPKRTLAHCMLVCKRWYRVASDEMLWQRLELGNRTIAKEALGRILSRKPVIVRLASSEIGSWHPTSNPTPSRIQYLDLSMCSIDKQTLNHLLERCPNLKKLSLEGIALDEQTCVLVGKCSNLEALNLTMTTGMTAEGLSAILEGCQNLHSLNIGWSGLKAVSAKVLCEKAPPSIRRLNIAGSKDVNDEVLSSLTSRCKNLAELDVSDCAVSGSSIPDVLHLDKLEHLAVSRCYDLPPASLTSLSALQSLRCLDVWMTLQTSSLATLKSALPGVQINQFMYSAIARPTVGARRTSIWGLRTRD